MKPNQNARQHRQGRPSQHNKPSQHHNQKRSGKGRQNQNRNQQPSSPTRQVESRGPAGSLRGNAKQLYEKYKALALEKRASDRVGSESLRQYADHYYRIYSEFAVAEAANQVAREKERAKKAQAEAERRANSVAESVIETVVEEQVLPVEPLELPEEPAPAEADSQNKNELVEPSKPLSDVAAELDNKDAEALVLDLDVPKENLAAPEAVKDAPKKRRGRPPKAKTEEKADAAEDEMPKKKVIRKPRRKIAAPDEETAEKKAEA